MSDHKMYDQIRNRNQRPSVKRNTSLESQVSSEASSSNQVSANEEQLPTQAEQLKKKLEAYPQIAPRRNIRLEESINQRIQQFCQEENVSIETFLEACFLACEQDLKLRQMITEEAKRRIEHRKQAGKLRRLYSQLQQLND